MFVCVVGRLPDDAAADLLDSSVIKLTWLVDFKSESGSNSSMRSLLLTLLWRS